MVGDITKKTNQAYTRLCELQAITMLNPTPSIVEEEAEAYEKWLKFADIEERFLRQKSKLHWLKLRDKNNKIFHNAAKMREMRNSIRDTVW